MNDGSVLILFLLVALALLWFFPSIVTIIPALIPN